MKKLIFLLMLSLAFACKKEVSEDLSTVRTQEDEFVWGNFLSKDSIGIEVGQTKPIYRYNDGDTLFLTATEITADELCPSPDAVCVNGRFATMWFKTSISRSNSSTYEFGLNMGGEIEINIDSTGKGHYLAFSNIIRYNLGVYGVKGRIAILIPIIR
jgi:hypothetical protein